jgi:hypothetical protein
MSNKLGGITLLLFIGLISILSAHNTSVVGDAVSPEAQLTKEFACKDLAVLDKRCATASSEVSEPLQVHDEINNLSESYWSQYLCRKNNSSYIVFDNTLYELKGVSFKGINYELSPADKLNGVEKSGNLSANAIASRSYSKDGIWTRWSDYKPPMNVSAEKINGQWQVEEWQVENQKRFTSVDCSNLPQ